MKLTAKFEDDYFAKGEVVEAEIRTTKLYPDYHINVSMKDKNGVSHCYYYNNLGEFLEEWEDYEEPKDFQYIMADGGIDLQPDNNSIFSNGLKEIGNYFETEEEAERAVEKLKAWKRLRDNGLNPTKWEWEQRFDDKCSIIVNFDVKFDSGVCDRDLDLLFGEEPVCRGSDEIRYTGKEDK